MQPEPGLKSSPADDALTIGRLARRFGLNPSAIRYYERVGVLPEPPREHGQRRYGPDAVRRLEVLEIAKRAGFTLDEARELIERSDGGAPSETLRDLAARKLAEVDALIARAETTRAWLVAAGDCACTTLEECGLFVTDAREGRAPAARRRPPPRRPPRPRA